MINGNLYGVEAYGTGAVIALLAIVMVFVVLIIIIVLTELVSKAVKKGETVETVKNVEPVSNMHSSLDINDEDATVACLIASIDYRNETKKNIQVIGVREVK